MNEENQTDLPEYVKKLPKAVQDLVFDSVWEDRTIEVGRKYTLNDSQINILANTVVLVLVGLEKPETFIDTLIGEMNISKLLAEQILEDLEVRVFDYATSQIKNKQPKIESKPIQPAPVQAVVQPIQPKVAPVFQNQTQNTPKVPEIKPNNLPAVEKGEVAHQTPQQEVSKRVFDTPKPPITNTLPKQQPMSKTPFDMSKQPVSVPKYTPPAGVYRPVSKVPEQVQRPVSVPRYGAPVETPQSMMDDKMKNITKAVQETPLKTGTVPPNLPTGNYHVDPYRESTG